MPYPLFVAPEPLVRYELSACLDPVVAVVGLAFRIVVPPLDPVAIVVGLAVPIKTGPVVELIAEDVLALVAIEVAKLPVFASVVDPVVGEVEPVEVVETPVLPGVADTIEFVCALLLAVVVPWLLVLPTWPMWTGGLIVPELALACLEFINRCLARDR